MPAASMAILLAMADAGIDYIFANLGSDHPGLIEAMAEARATGRRVPELLTVPNEMVALSAAHGHAQISRRAQAVLVHVECGTQALAGAVHNADKGRIPVLIFAGASPFTQHGELPGSRNEFIHWIQDVHDQRGIVRGYMRYDAEIRTGRNGPQMLHRALQFAHSDPQGPVYLVAAREILEDDSPPAPADPTAYPPITPPALPPDAVATLLAALAAAEKPLIVTSYLGRNPRAVPLLVTLCERFGIAVLESVPNFLNFPSDHKLHQGNQWNQPVQNPALAAADFLLVIDADVPWIPSISRPADGVDIFHIDVDPLKQNMPLFHIGARKIFRADAATVLTQLLEAANAGTTDHPRVAARRAYWAVQHEARIARLRAAEQPSGARMTPEFLVSRIRPRIDTETIVMNETITSYGTVCSHLGMTRPGSFFGSGGGSLGWNGGAAIGAKLAAPEKTVIALSGDGCYMFSQPSTVHWMARRYGTPFLQIVFNNGGYTAPRFSALALHPDGYAVRANDIGVSFSPAPDYAAIATAAGGAHGRIVRHADELDPALDEALRVVRDEKRCAVLDVWLQAG